MSLKYYMLIGETIVTTEDIHIWSAYMAQDPDTSGRRVGLTFFDKFDKPARLSTIMLGLDQNFLMSGPPILFESCFFYGTERFSYTRVIARYDTLNVARAAHAELVNMINLIEDISKIIRPELGEGEGIDGFNPS